MAKLRLLIGTAGSGKTHAVLDQAARLAAESPLPVPGHPPVLVIVPEQQAVQTERALLKRLADLGHPAASARLRVASLTRLARLLRQQSGVQRDSLSELGRRLLCWKLLPEGRENKSRAGSLAAVIGSLASYGTSPEQLEAAAASLQGESGEAADNMLPGKLGEICEAYSRYEKQCSELGLEFLSPVEEIPALLAEPPWPEFDRTHVFIDGFSGFTPPEEHAVAAIAGACGAVTGTVLIDPARAAGPLPPDLADWYEPTRGLLEAWERIAETTGCSLDMQVLQGPGRWPAGSALAALATHGQPGNADGVAAVAATDIRAEVDAAAAHILDHVAAGARFRDISVITHQLPPYADLIEARFADAGIPVFIDRRRELKHHPAVEYFRCGGRLSLGLAEPEELHTWLKTGLPPVPDGENPHNVIDRLDAYGRDFDLQPWQWLTEKPWSRHVRLLPPLDGVSRITDEERAAAQTELAELDRWRRIVVAPLAAAAAAVDDAKESGELSAMLTALWHELVEQPLAGRLEQLDAALAAGAEGRHVMVAEVLELIAGLLSEMLKVAGDQAVQPAELAGWLEYGLSSLTHAQPPPVLDNVLVTEAERGRNPDVKHTLLLGLSEGVWPSSLSEPPLLSDRERAQLNRDGRRLIPGGAEETAARGAYNLLVAATRPAESLYLSRPLAAADGRVLRPSPYLEILLQLLGDVTPGILPQTEGLISLADVAALASLNPLDRGLAELSDELLSAGTPGSAAEHVSRGLAWGRETAAARGGTPPLDPAVLFGGIPAESRSAIRMSASRLEQFAACPFKHYANYFLGLEDRSPSEFTPALLGSLYHHVFEEAVVRLAGSGYDWLSGDPVPVRDALQSVLADMRDEFSELANRRRVSYILERARLLCELHAASMAKTAVDGRRTPRLAELRFGPEPQADLPAVRIALETADVLLSGYIDRVDVGPAGATVVDYKLSGRSVEWDRFLAGAQIQLPVYLLALAEGGDQSLAPDYAEFQPVEPEWSSGNRASLRARGMPQQGTPTQSAEPGYKSSLENILDETRRIIVELARRMLSGEIAARPLRQGTSWLACSSCSFRPVCRFDPASGASYRVTHPGPPAQLRDRLMAGESFPGSAGGEEDQSGGEDQGAGDG